MNTNVEIWVESPGRSGFPLKTKILLALWWLVQMTLFRMSPHPMHAWRRALLRLFGAQIGAGSSVHATAKIWFPGNLVMGRHSGIAFETHVYNLDTVVIEDRVSIAHRVHLNTASHDYRDPGFLLLTKPITIRSGAFVGTDTYIGPGVTIGEMAVIGARSVVTKDMPQEMVCYGHPCRPIKRREKAHRGSASLLNNGRETMASVCVVSSGGGHLTEALALRPAYAGRPHFFVLNQAVDLSAEMQEKTYCIRHSERDLLFFVNLWEAWRILRRERPGVILSTGAGPAVPFAVVGKLLGIPSVFVECSTQILRPSLTGRIMYYLADRFYYQWQPLKRSYPKGRYGGVLLWSS